MSMWHKKSNNNIELYGVPGAGKSTLARQLESEKKLPVVQPFTTGYFLSSWLLVRYPVTTARWLWLYLQCWRRNRSVMVLRYNLVLFFGSLAAIHQARSVKNLVVIDEGLVQRLLSASDILLTEEQICRLLPRKLVGSRLLRVTDVAAGPNRYHENHPRRVMGEAAFTRWCENLRKNEALISVWLQANNFAVTAFDRSEFATFKEDDWLKIVS